MITQITAVPSKRGFHKSYVVTVDGNLDQPIVIAFNSVGRDGATYHFEDEVSGTIEEGGCDYPNGILPPSIMTKIRQCLAYYRTNVADELKETIEDILNYCLGCYGNMVQDESVYGCTASIIIKDNTMSMDDATNRVKELVETNGGESIPCLSTAEYGKLLITEANAATRYIPSPHEFKTLLKQAHFIAMTEAEKNALLKENKPGTWYDGWQPYCMTCNAMARMLLMPFGFECGNCKNQIGFDLKRLQESPLNDPLYVVPKQCPHTALFDMLSSKW